MVKAVTQTTPDAETGWSRRRHASRRRSGGVRHNLRKNKFNPGIARNCSGVVTPLFYERIHACMQECMLLQLVPETEKGFRMIQTQRTGTNMFYEWSLKKRCIR